MLLEYSCPSDKLCGGLGDRFVHFLDFLSASLLGADAAHSMLGITSTFLYALLTGRALSISWEHPSPIDILFDSPHIDWSQRFKVASTPPRTIYTNDTLTRLKLEGTHNPSAEALDRTMPSLLTGQEHQNDPWITLEALNRGAF